MEAGTGAEGRGQGRRAGRRTGEESGDRGRACEVTGRGGSAAGRGFSFFSTRSPSPELGRKKREERAAEEKPVT